MEAPVEQTNRARRDTSIQAARRKMDGQGPPTSGGGPPNTSINVIPDNNGAGPPPGMAPPGIAPPGMNLPPGMAMPAPPGMAQQQSSGRQITMEEKAR